MYGSGVCGCAGAVVVPDAEGLQVLRRTGEWEELPMMPGALVVNLGDFMEVSPSPLAFSFVVFGCHPDDPHAHHVGISLTHTSFTCHVRQSSKSPLSHCRRQRAVSGRCALTESI